MNFFDPPTPANSNMLGAWMRWVKDALHNNRPCAGQNVRIDYTNNGAFIHATGGEGGAGTGAGLQFKGDWADGAYNQGDIVIRRHGSGLYGPESDKTDFDKMREGTYYATEPIVAGDLPPGENAGAGATLTVTVTGGAITSIALAIDDPSFQPYPANAWVQITGDGTGASAHATFDGTGRPTAIVVDNGGSGYTQAKTTAILMNGGKHWDDFALFRTEKWVLIAGNQRITIDVGRDAATDLKILIEKDSTITDGSSPAIRLDIAQLMAIVPTSGTPVYNIQFYELETCEGNVPYHRLFLCSDKY
jgi:hypothetical protein